ncbi:MAG: Gfo/Idh/MocA family oxidoreductase [Opitutaceae bacterium]|nr:Gfo/Idh/MocA family oxidoreductase [Opitutaceae bacterium]
MNTQIDRREFLRRSTAAAAAIGLPNILPAAALGASKKISLGCIGVGGMGTSNMKNFLALEDCRVVAVCDPYQDRREKAKNLVDTQYGDRGCAMFGDYRELIARRDIDAVMIATQDHWHALIATSAAAAGKDLYCEKPMGVSVEQGQKIRQAVRQHQRMFQAGTWQRSQTKFRHACELARNGYVGKIHTVQVSAEGSRYQPKYAGPLDPQPVPAGFDWEMWRGPAPDRPYNPGRVAWPDWYLIWDYCAGFICNWGVHHFDIANWGCPTVAEERCEIECKATYRTQGFTDNVEDWNATFAYASGLKMIFTNETHQKLGCRFIGDQGWVHVDRAGIWAEPESLLKVKLKENELHLHQSDNHGDDFLRSVRSRQDPVSNVDATHVASYLGLIADIAARLETKLMWDPKLEKFIGNDEANARLIRPMRHGWKL